MLVPNETSLEAISIQFLFSSPVLISKPEIGFRLGGLSTGDRYMLIN
jgi:hypothetical protein